MNKWADRIGVGLLLVSVVAGVGCEFETSGDSDSFNSSDFSWVNFSGVYKAVGGGVLVSDFTSGSGGGSTTNAIDPQPQIDEVIGEGNGSAHTFSGALDRRPVIVGSLSIAAGAFNLEDNGDGTLSGNIGSTGGIDYGTGAWSINLQGIPLEDGVDITADYEYDANGGGGSGGGDGGNGQGSSGAAIFTFTVFQAGNKIEITDNNGAKYNGQLGKVATTGGLDGDNPVGTVPSVGDSAIAEYTAEGTSAAGVNVLMTGTFQGVVAQGSGSLFFTDRRMLGTWIEPKGVTGDINGSASPVGIAATTTTTAVAQ